MLRSSLDASRRRLAAVAVLAGLTALAPTLANAQAAAARPNKVVMQVSDADPGKWNLALNNASNLQEALGAKNVDLEIVVYGPGIGMLKTGSAVEGRVATAVNNGVKVVACENTMRAQKLTKADMLPDAGYVPGGVVEIMQKQQQGWAYIRP